MLLSSFLLLPLLSTATPLAPRACAIEKPTFIGWIDSSNPDFNSNPLADNTLTLALKDPGRVIDTLVEFKVPAGSWGCQLELFFQKDYTALYSYSSGPARVNVFNTDGPIPLGPYNYSMNWNLAPKPTNLFGTSTNLETPPRYGYREDVKKIINSAPCKDKMTYRVKVPEEIANGGLQFYQLNGPPFGGWRMTHNC